jgi:hypothetical protein
MNRGHLNYYIYFQRAWGNCENSMRSFLALFSGSDRGHKFLADASGTQNPTLLGLRPLWCLLSSNAPQKQLFLGKDLANMGRKLKPDAGRRSGVAPLGPGNRERQLPQLSLHWGKPSDGFGGFAQSRNETSVPHPTVAVGDCWWGC